MFSYLRPHHKRGSSSNPTSPLPLPSTPHSSDFPLHSPDFFPPPPRLPDNESLHSESPVSPVAPVLPPIPRVASRYDQTTSTARGYNVQGGYEGSKENARLADTVVPEARVRKDNPTNPTISVEKPHDSTSRPGTVGSTVPQYPGSGSHTRPGPLRDTEGHAVSAPSVRPSSSTPLYSSTKPSASTLPPQRAAPPPPPPPPKSPSPVQPSSHHFRSGKAKLNLLNPMSLLMRRRSAQGLPPVPASLANDKSLILPAMPDDYDPRIRGTAIHDFSAPRQKRNYSTNDVGVISPGIGSGKSPVPSHGDDGLEHPTSKFGDGNDGRLTSPKKGDWDHSPMFKEQFGDDIQPWREGLTKEPSVPEEGSKSSILLSPLDIPEPDREPPPLPPFARNLPSDLALTLVPRPDVDNSSRSKVLAVVPEAGSPDALPQNLPAKLPSPNSPPKTRSRTLSGSDRSPQPTGPKRIASNASRFSFDMGGLGSVTQEKILEEKHKEHAAAKQSSKIMDGNDPHSRDTDDYDDDEMDDYDGLDDEGPYEEQIPGVNTDADDEVQLDHGDVGAFDFTSSRISTIASPTSPSTGTLVSPRDSSGQLIGFAMSKESPQRHSLPSPSDGPVPPQLENSDRSSEADGLGLMGLDTVLGGSGTQASIVAQSANFNGQCASESLDPEEGEDDDLYFDDGIIEHPGDDAGRDFDESVFDLEKEAYNRSILDLQPPRPLNFSTTDSSPAKYTSEEDENDSIVPQDSQSTDTTYPPLMNPAGNALGYQASISRQHQADESSFGEPSGLTQDNLAAYHNALVAAANQAAANGKFIRCDSASDFGRDSHGAYDDEPHPDLLPDDGHYSQGTDKFSPNGFGGNEDDDFDYDSALEDDPMIAAANAEALANDADGFYGQEFGFYAQANGANEAQYVNGGYFGLRGPEGMIRSKSGRIILQEPNLTPITERSEYSTRNSYISLSIPGPQTNQTLTSPALAQLMSSSFADDDDLSLSALMKLRRGAWGGSNGSLRSAGSGGSQASSSPFAYLPPFGAGGIALANASQLGGSSFSLASSGGVASSNGQNGSNESSVPASPTITVANLAAMGASGAGNGEGGDGLSPAKTSTVAARKGKKNGHSRAGSGADSVSYMKEEDTWVLERRRMSTTGEVELVGREVVAGGRI
ncbi:MAG: hypothetical protein M1812_007238 [Candelaria pacifica]|nr:MAG: hypothetical protein M1812_007238 [Candelaria pacifica]